MSAVLREYNDPWDGALTQEKHMSKEDRLLELTTALAGLLELGRAEAAHGSRMWAKAVAMAEGALYSRDEADPVAELREAGAI